MITHAYKAFTHDLRPPIQGGRPVWDGSLPYQLPTTRVDTSNSECGVGWNACLSTNDILKIVGLWPDGRPTRIFSVETDTQVYTRVNKTRATTWTITKEITDFEPIIRDFWKDKGLNTILDGLVQEQLLWREALSRKTFNQEVVHESLNIALQIRNLSWTCKKYKSPVNVWEAWDAQIIQTRWDQRASQDAWLGWLARRGEVPHDAHGASWADGDIWDEKDKRAVHDARDALTYYIASSMNWVSRDPYFLTTGIRAAYSAGLALAVPIGPNELGWAMSDEL